MRNTDLNMEGFNTITSSPSKYSLLEELMTDLDLEVESYAAK